MESSAPPYCRVVFAIIQILCCFTSSPATACPFSERNLLLDFKAAVVDDYNRLSSWQGFNCCTWRGVGCNLRTGHVTRLDLGGYELRGLVNSSMFQLAELKHLDLSENFFNGSFAAPHDGKLKSLIFLDLSGYILREFHVSLESLSNLPSLKYLSLFGANISGSKNWGEAVGSLSNLQQLSMSDCGLGGPIPNSLLNLTSLLRLHLSDNSLSGKIPAWFQNVTAHLLSLDLSYNHNLGGDLSFLTAQRKSSLSLTSVDLSGTDMEGQIPYAIGNMSSLQHLGLSYTSIGDLANNQLKGRMPTNWANLKEIHTLKLNGNYLTGVIPSSISKCPSLQVLDLGNNDFEGVIPHWIGKLSKLHVLLLRSNRFHGSIPRQIIGLPNLQILDVSGNHLSGSIPSNLTYLLAMVNASQSNPNHLEEQAVYNLGTYTNQITISWKGWDVEFVKVLFILKCIDLSSNNFSGSIPLEMGSLKGLIALNLSRNHLSGRIPKTLGDMEQLESLDLSLNRLSGSIPLELQLLSYLEFLNLSFNMQLDGKVPHGGQLLTFGESSYLGNPKLSGIPFTNITVCSNSSGFENCTKVETIGDAESSDAEMIGWAVGLGLSYGLGFSIVIGILTFNMRAKKIAFNLYDVVIIAIDRSVTRGNR